MTIRSRNFPYNMAPWVAEKSEHVCEEACQLADQMRALPIPEDQRQELLSSLQALLYDATKLVEYAYDTDFAAWEPDLAQTIMERGHLGFRHFIARVKEYSDLESFKPFPLGE